MNRMRSLVLVSGLAALAMPAVAGAQSAVGGDKYGGAEVGEDLGDTGDTKDSAKPAESTKKKKAAPKTVEEPLMPEDSESTTTEPVEDETQDTIKRSPPASTAGPDAEAPDLNVDVDERTATPAVTAPLATTRVETVDHSQTARLRTPFGMALSVGGGVTNFVDDDIQGMTNTGGSWEARLSVGTRSMLGLEAAYVGSANDIEALGLDGDAVLVGNGLEGLARLNLGTFRLQPYLVAGAGWTRYEVAGEDFNTSSVNPEDDIFTVPLGAGLSTRLGGGLLLDGRFTYRLTYEEDLLQAGTGNEVQEDLDSWGATMRLGYEF